jgi:hypothetical protein
VTSGPAAGADVVTRYLELGLRAGRLLDGLVDAYYGPADLAARVAAEPPPDPAALRAEARRLLADLAPGAASGAVGPAGEEVDATRRRWISAQVRGLEVTAERFTGASIGFVEEVERCYGVRPTRVDDDELAAARRRLESVLPGEGPVGERLIAWRESHAVPPDRLEGALVSLADDLRERTAAQFGLPDGEHIDFDVVTGQPWSGFNYYLGGLRSRVAINTDLPVLSLSLGHLVAHEAYPGHHTEHSRKEAGLVRTRGHLEETIFLVGTPQCLLAEGLADLGLEVVVPADRPAWLDDHLRPLGIRYDAEVAATVGEATEVLGNGVRGNVAHLLHVDGASPDDAVAYAERFGLLPRNRAEKLVQFQTDPTWRAYVFCYIDGLRLCRSYVDGRPERFGRLLTEALVPQDLVAA